MDTKVYYGEYSLQHWIDLILAKNITLPEYQRSFVWDKNQIEDFINSLKAKDFIQPVTVGNFDNKNNYIIDGQQRLTSLLLAYIGKFPDTQKFKKVDDEFAEIDESLPDDDGNVPIEWQFTYILENSEDNTREAIRNRIEQQHNDKYENIDFGIEAILKDTYLGFSFIVPKCDAAAQQKFYCTVFRNMNIKGTSLLTQESRRSLYFLDKDKKDFFDTDVFSDCLLLNNKKTTKVDFIRYVALASNYAKEQDYSKVLKFSTPYGTSNKYESYYEKFINEVIDESKTDPVFKKFSEIFPGGKYDDRLEKLKSTLKAISFETKYASIIEADITFFGLVYYVLICDRSIDESKIADLKKAIKEKLAEYKQDGEANKKQERNPNQLSFLRKRLQDSNEIYANFLV